MRDTSPKMAKKMREMMMAKTPSERATMGLSMHHTSKLIVISSILHKDPNISEGKLSREVFLRFYGHEYTPEKREKIAQYFENLPPGTFGYKMVL